MILTFDYLSVLHDYNFYVPLRWPPNFMVDFRHEFRGLLPNGRKMVPRGGLEPPTYRLGICRSVLMSYRSTLEYGLALSVGICQIYKVSTGWKLCRSTFYMMENQSGT